MRSLLLLLPGEDPRELGRLMCCCTPVTEKPDLLRLCFSPGEGGPLPLPPGIGRFLQMEGEGLGDGWDLSLPAACLLRFLDQEPYDLILASASPDAAGLLALLAGMTRAVCMTEVLALAEENGALVCEKYLYNMNLKGRFLLGDSPVMISVSALASMSPGADTAYRAPDAVICPPEAREPAAHWEAVHIPEERRLAGAKKVLVLGRGAGGRSAFEKAGQLTDRLGWALGASRPPVQEAAAPQALLVGASGALLQAEKCLVLGVSGMAAFSVGIEGCREVLAVNTDEDAAIFSVSDLGLQADCVSLLDRLLVLSEENTP